MQTTTHTAQEILAEILGIPAPQTKIEAIEQACLALFGDKKIRPNDKPDTYCAKLKLVSEPTPSFLGGSAKSPQSVSDFFAISILNQYPEIPLPACKELKT